MIGAHGTGNPWFGSTAPPFRRGWSKVNYLAMNEARSLGLTVHAKADLNWPMVEVSSWMKLVRCRWRHRPSCCEYYKME